MEEKMSRYRVTIEETEDGRNFRKEFQMDAGSLIVMAFDRVGKDETTAHSGVVGTFSAKEIAAYASTCVELMEHIAEIAGDKRLIDIYLHCLVDSLKKMTGRSETDIREFLRQKGVSDHDIDALLATAEESLNKGYDPDMIVKKMTDITTDLIKKAKG